MYNQLFYKDHPVIVLAGVVCFSCLGTTKEPIVCQHQQEKENSPLILDFNLKSIGRPACFSAF